MCEQVKYRHAWIRGRTVFLFPKPIKLPSHLLRCIKSGSQTVIHESLGGVKGFTCCLLKKCTDGTNALILFRKFEVPHA